MSIEFFGVKAQNVHGGQISCIKQNFKQAAVADDNADDDDDADSDKDN